MGVWDFFSRTGLDAQKTYFQFSADIVIKLVQRVLNWFKESPLYLLLDHSAKAKLISEAIFFRIIFTYLK